jgi:tungstate transport system ATP-binding protein
MTMRAPSAELPICFSDVTVETHGVTILDRITLALGGGTPTVLIGPNGSGKTTFLRVAMGLTSPSAGTITWGGRESVAPVRRAIVFQHPVMLRRTAAENLRYALKASLRVPRERHDARIAELLSLVGLSEFGDRPARRMSGGEKQRLALARALARDPAVLFLDEPSGSLDPAAAKAVGDVIGTVTARNIKIIMSTHDLGSARRLAGDIIFMHRGRVVETGAASTFFNEPHSDEAKIFISGDLLV